MFIALKSIKEQRKELESMVRLYASFSWDDFIVYEVRMGKKRKQKAEEREGAIARLMGFAQWGIAGLLVFGSALGLRYGSWANYW